MSLNSFRDTIMEIAEEMAKESEDLKDRPEEAFIVLRSYSRQLKVACKAAGDDPPQSSSNPLSMFLSPQSQHRAEIDKYREEFRKNKNGGANEIAIEENFSGGDLAEIRGGPVNSDEIPTYQRVDPSMPVGARTDIAGSVYQLQVEEGKKILIYDGDATEKRSELK